MHDEIPSATRALLQGAYEAFNARNIDAALATMQPDARFHFLPPSKGRTWALY